MTARPTSPKLKTAAPGFDARARIAPAVRQMLDNFNLEEVPSHLLRRAHFLAEERFAREFADEALTPRQKAALISVYKHPGLSQNALADHLHMDRNTVAEMVRRLVASQLLQRTDADDDQRAYQLFLAPAGAQVLERVMPRDLLLEQRTLDCLPEEYRPLFMKCLRLLVAPTTTPKGDVA